MTFMSEDSVTRALETPRLGHILDGKTVSKSFSLSFFLY